MGEGDQRTLAGTEQARFHWGARHYREKIMETLAGLREKRVMDRLWNRDHTLWKNRPSEIMNRLGWLDTPSAMPDLLPGILKATTRFRESGFTDALLLGMGGSSLAPDLFGKTFGHIPGYLDLRVLDSTDPGAVEEHTSRLDLSRTLFIVSTKSGTTAETLSFFKHFYNRTADALGADRAGEHFVAITDPGSSLEASARAFRFSETFLNDPDIGGRYSALSCFGMVPAALMGIDTARLLERAASMARNCGPLNDPVEGDNTGAILGAVLGSLHNEGVDKLTFITSPALAPLGSWLEQLIAESTGKEGKGILPVDGEIPSSPGLYGRDRVFVYLRLAGDTTYEEQFDNLRKSEYPFVSIELEDLYDLGAEFFRWEVATAVAGHVMGINPFDQPDVESTKVATRAMLESYRRDGRLPPGTPAFTENGIEVYSDLDGDSLADILPQFLSGIDPGGYVAIQAFLHPTGHAALALSELRHRIRDRYMTATTSGFGPRYLHSTGQLHKGDGGKGLFIQITGTTTDDLSIPDEAGSEASSMTFGVLEAAQAAGDLQALRQAGRKMIRFHITGDVVEGIRQLKGAIS